MIGLTSPPPKLQLDRREIGPKVMTAGGSVAEPELTGP